MRKVAGRVLVLLLVLAFVVGAAFVVDAFARHRTEAAIATRISGTLPGLRGADVTVAGTPFLTQLAAGRFDRVDVTADALVTGGLELRDVDVTLTDVSRDEPTAGTLTATASASTDALSAAAPGLAFVVEGDQLVATLATAPLAAVVVPTAGGDGIELEVTELRLGGVTVSPEDLPLGLGDAFQGLRVPVTLPAGLTLDEVAVSATGLDLTVGGRDVVLTLPPTTGPSAPG